MENNTTLISLEVENGVVKKVWIGGQLLDAQQQDQSQLSALTIGPVVHVASIFYTSSDTLASQCCKWVMAGGKLVWKCDPC